MQITTRSVSGADIDVIAAFIAARNRRPEQRCLHAGDVSEDVRAALLEFDPSFAATFTVAVAMGEKSGDQLHDGRLLGVVGGDLQLAISRAWLWGPWVDDGFWNVVAAPLLDRFLWFVRELDQVKAFVDLAAVRGAQLLRARGFADETMIHVYLAKPRDSAAATPHASTDRPDLRVAGLESSQEAHFRAMHDLIFDQQTPGEELLRERSSDRPIFAATRSGALVGYVAASVQAGPLEGFVEYLGVDPSARGLGIGRMLLERALHWAFDERGLPQVGLTVSDQNANARGLYESVGFSLEYTGLGFRRHREALLT
ncbi:MAG: GNAT family N-acetyltransferase [Candidatus Eisenbacteria bacterium]|nr:GNAT family N-acetyltransferase [Candidatus Eisenbacteria bacterium]MCC7140825.1 GNAT family N-acetyltransferase [Candidatus Eisenbacteria bacterium]